MRIALIAPPFIAIPPKQYGGTELFVAQLALGLAKTPGVEVVVYTNGESTIPVERKWLYPKGQWPLKDDVYFSLRDLEHHAWAVKDASRDCDLIHVNNLAGVTYSRYLDLPFVYTVHHPQNDDLMEIYEHYPDVHFACISQLQANGLGLKNSQTIYHGLDPAQYVFKEHKQDYLAFLGRVAPVKGVHLAIAVAKKTGIPLKIAGELQPLYDDYWQKEVKPHIDGKFIEFIGEVGPADKNELLANARALLFPIQWDEPFGLVMIEAMACGTPVLALNAGSVPEVVREGISGHICRSVDELAHRASTLSLPATGVRRYVEDNFSLSRMVNGYRDLYEHAINRRSPASVSFDEPESKIA